MTPPKEPKFAWRDLDVVLVGCASSIGTAAWIAAWVGVHHAASLSHQTAWLNLGVAGLTAFGVGNAWWLLRGRRAVGGRRVSIVRLEATALDQTGAFPRATSGSAEASTATRTMTETGVPSAVRVPGSDLAHRVGCPLVAGKEAVPADAVGTKPCRVCSS